MKQDFIDPSNITLGDSEEASTEEDIASPDNGAPNDQKPPKFRVASRYSSIIEENCSSNAIIPF